MSPQVWVCADPLGEREAIEITRICTSWPNAPTAVLFRGHSGYVLEFGVHESEVEPGRIQWVMKLGVTGCTQDYRGWYRGSLPRLPVPLSRYEREPVV